jgi:hypothetical protein
MINISAVEFAKALEDDLDALRNMLSEFDALLDRVVRGPERDAMIRHVALLRLRIAELPKRIAARGPFKNNAHVDRCVQGEVRRALVTLTEAEIFLKAVGSM